MSDNLKTMTVKVRGEFGAGKTELVALIERTVRGFGMQTRIDADGHNLTITSTNVERCKLYAANHPDEEPKAKASSS